MKLTKIIRKKQLDSLKSEDIRFVIEFKSGIKSGETHIITNDGTCYVVEVEDGQRLVADPITKFMESYLHKRNIINLGLGNRIYFTDRDKYMVKETLSNLSKSKNNAFTLYDYFINFEKELDIKRI